LAKQKKVTRQSRESDKPPIRKNAKFKATRKATPIVSVSLAQAKNTAKLPAGKNTLLVIGQNIDDRTAVLFWEMFVKPNAKYVVTVKDKFVFGSPASALAITVLENGMPLTVKQVAEPT
jgi:hypothetical protein